jgi:FixJ family two-component response regulator
MSEKADENDNLSDPTCSEMSDKDHHGSGTIIIMDDEEYIRDSLSDMLMCMGYDVIHMEEGGEVISFLKEKHSGDEKISGIILDLVIPRGMGGKDTAAEIQKITPEIPVFVISGYSDDPVMVNPHEYGFTDGLSKPFLMKDLADMLGRHL